MGACTLIGTLMLTNPLVVEASDKKYEEKKIEWLNKAKSLGKKAVEYSSKAEEKVFAESRSLSLAGFIRYSSYVFLCMSYFKFCYVFGMALGFLWTYICRTNMFKK